MLPGVKPQRQRPAGLTGLPFGHSTDDMALTSLRPPSALSPVKRTMRRAQSAVSLEVVEVQSLANDKPRKGDIEIPRSPHEALLQRLKSRGARQEAEVNRAFLQTYRSTPAGAAGPPNQENEEKLESLLKSTERKVEELRQRSEEFQNEVVETERQIERLNSVTVQRATEIELLALKPFERSQRKILEDKREEDLQRQKDDLQTNFKKIHRKLQNELAELRDYKVLLQELRQIRLERLNQMLDYVTDGRKLRSCVRDMLRHGAQRTLQRLENCSLQLEPWMHEVVINACHLEIRIEDAEARLLQLRRAALQPVRSHVKAMLDLSKEERYERLFTRSLLMRQQQKSAPTKPLKKVKLPGLGGDLPGGQKECTDAVAENSEVPAGTPAEDGGAEVLGADALLPGGRWVMPEKVVAELRAVEVEIEALQRLLTSMNHNSAAVICNQVRQAEKAGGQEAAKAATEWGRRTLILLVSEDFAKRFAHQLQVR